MAARSSTTKETGRAIQGGAISTRKSATRTATTVASTRANIEVMNVPMMNAPTPKTCLFGSHVVDQRNDSPLEVIESQASLVSTKNVPRIVSSRMRAAM